MDPNHITYWYNPVTGYASAIEFPRTHEHQLHMQQAYWEKMQILIEEGMRKKRALKMIEDHFTSSFIEDVPVPYLGFKKLHISGAIKRISKTPPPKLVKLSDKDMWHLDPKSYKEPVPDEFEMTDVKFVSAYNGHRWELDGSIEAICGNESSDHDPSYVPHPWCSCGIYAYNLKQTEVMQPLIYGNVGDVANVVVSLGGHVIPYSHGYRASIAKIEALISKTGYWSIGDSFGDRPTDKPIKRGIFITHSYTEDVPRFYQKDTIVPVQSIATSLGGVPVISPSQLPQFFKEYTKRWQTP